MKSFIKWLQDLNEAIDYSKYGLTQSNIEKNPEFVKSLEDHYQFRTTLLNALQSAIASTSSEQTRQELEIVLDNSELLDQDIDEYMQDLVQQYRNREIDVRGMEELLWEQKRSISESLVDIWSDYANDPEVQKELEKIMVITGLKPVGNVGQEVPFDGLTHQWSDDHPNYNISSNDPAKVHQVGWTMKSKSSQQDEDDWQYQLKRAIVGPNKE